MSGTVSNNAADVPPRGSGGGLPGSATEYRILSATEFERLAGEGRLPEPETIGGRRMETPANATVTVAEGDLFHVTNGGGGGLGDPLLRDPALVARDLADGYVHEQLARQVYGVVLDADGGVDEAATATARAEIRRDRLGADPSRQVLPAAEIEVGVGVRMSGDAWACGYCAAELGSLSGNYRAACVERTRPGARGAGRARHARARA